MPPTDPLAPRFSPLGYATVALIPARDQTGWTSERGPYCTCHSPPFTRRFPAPSVIYIDARIFRRDTPPGE
jgi:hypothetical protein